MTLTGSEPSAATEMVANELGKTTPEGAAESGADSSVAALLAGLTEAQRAELVKLLGLSQ